MGIVSPVGCTLDDAWHNVCEGNSGAVLLDGFDEREFTTRIAGPVQGFDLDKYVQKKDQRKYDPFVHYGVAASVDAIVDAGLDIDESNGHRIGIAMGAGIGGIKTIEDNHNKMLAGGARKISPFLFPAASST